MGEVREKVHKTERVINQHRIHDPRNPFLTPCGPGREDCLSLLLIEPLLYLVCMAALCFAVSPVLQKRPGKSVGCRNSCDLIMDIFRAAC